LPKALKIVPKASWNSNFEGSFNQIQTSGTGGRERTNRFSNGSSLSFSGSIPIGQYLRMITSLAPRGSGGEKDSVEVGREMPARSGGRRGGTTGQGGILSIGAVAASYSISKTNRLDRVSGEPAIGYQLGWSRDPGANVTKRTGSSASSGDRNDLNLSTDIKIFTEISIRTTFNLSKNESSVNGAISTTETRRFPDLSINWGRMYKKLGLDRFTKELRATTNYQRSRSEQASGGTRANTRIETKTSMSPLLNLDAKLTNGFSAKLTSRYDSSQSEQKSGTFTNTSQTKRRQVGLTLSRVLNLSRMVTNPITGKKSRVTSKLNLSITTNYGDERRETSQGGKTVVGSDHVRLDFSTTAGYNFTSSISGNAALSFGQDTDRKNRTNTVRSIGVTVSAAFRF
jgi:hypothetical protein